MPISERAKQFMPFAAVKGLTEALEKKEKLPVAKVEMSEERIDEINQKLAEIKKGMTVTVTYFHDDEYIQLTGVILQLDTVVHELQIADSKIAFSTILDIDVEGF